MKRVRVAITGASGRMGQELVDKSQDFKSVEFITGISRRGGPQTVKTLSDLDANKIDVLIDFSLPEFFDEILAWCLANKKKLVSGTTGLSPKQHEKISSAGQEIAILWAPNMSLGIALIKKMLAHFSAEQGYSFQIEEAHHKGKKDSPSGTAIVLQEVLQKAVNQTLPPIHSIRDGEVFGVHKIIARSQEETITLEHQAHGRSVFAKGALRAAEWIYNKGPGRYRLEDILSELK